MVAECERSEDGITQKYKVRTANGQVYERDIRKLVVLERGDDNEVVVLESGGDEV